jgi:hypothetical protein
MGTLVLAGATSGSSTLTPVDAVTAVITLPSATATLATLGANTFVGNQAITGTLSATDIYTVAWTDYTATSTIVGWASFSGSKRIAYLQLGKLVFVQYDIGGVSNSTSITFTLPLAGANTAAITYGASPSWSQDNGVAGTNPARLYMSGGTSTVNILKELSGTAWTASGNKTVVGQFFYQTT